MTGKQSVPRAFALILLLVVPLAATSVHADAVRPTAGGWVPMGPPVAWPGLRGVGVYGWDQYCEVAYAKIDHLPSPYSPGRGYGCTHWSSRVGSAHYLPAHGLAVLVSDPRWPLEVTTVSADDPTRTYVNKLHGVPLLASASDDANVYLVIDWEGGRVERYEDRKSVV